MKRGSAILEVEKLFEEVYKTHELEIGKKIYSAISTGKFQCEFDSRGSKVAVDVESKYGKEFLKRFFKYLGFEFEEIVTTKFGAKLSIYLIKW